MRSTARYGDGWLSSLQPPRDVAESAARLAELAAEYQRPAPRVGAVIQGTLVEKSSPEIRNEHIQRIADRYGTDIELIREAGFAGAPAELAEKIAEYREAGVDTVAFTGGGDWDRTCDLLAHTSDLC